MEYVMCSGMKNGICYVQCRRMEYVMCSVEEWNMLSVVGKNGICYVQWNFFWLTLLVVTFSVGVIGTSY